jgi:hypothetical protein
MLNRNANLKLITNTQLHLSYFSLELVEGQNEVNKKLVQLWLPFKAKLIKDGVCGHPNFLSPPHGCHW